MSMKEIYRGNMLGSYGKRAGLFLVVFTALALILPGAAVAATNTWGGGHDAQGFDEASRKLYFAEGTTRNGFEEYLIIRNPLAENSVVDVAYQFSGEETPLYEQLTLSPGAGVSILVNDVVGSEKDVSIELIAEKGITAEREMYFNYRGVWTGGHVSSGVSEPSDIWYFAEGTTHSGFNEWICLQNPNIDEVDVKLTYMLGTGENIVENMQLNGSSRSTVDVNSAVGPGRDVSVMIESGSPIIAERPMYFDYKGAWRGGHITAGSVELGKEWYFAEGTTRTGFEEWLSIMNPGEETTASVEYQFADGPSAVMEYTLRAYGRTTVFVNEAVGPERDVSMKVTSESEILCERPVYFYYHFAQEGGHVVMGSPGGTDTWYFPTSAVGPGFESWLCVMNTGGEANSVKVDIFNQEGAHNEKYYDLAPRTRMTVSLNSLSEGIQGSWVKVTGVDDIVVERPTYFSYSPAVSTAPFMLAIWNGVEIQCPVRYEDYVGAVYHEAYPTGSGGLADNPQVMQPVGICLLDDNPSMRCPGLCLGLGNDPAYFIEDSRGRGTYSTTACDIISKAGTTVYAPVTGTVIAAESYKLYGSYPDLRVRIAIDGHPGYHMAVLHMSSISVSVGQRVEAGETPVGIVRDLVPYFNSGPNPYTREEGNHPHIQINYRPDMGLSNNGQYAGTAYTP